MINFFRAVANVLPSRQPMSYCKKHRKVRKSQQVQTLQEKLALESLIREKKSKETS